MSHSLWHRFARRDWQAVLELLATLERAGEPLLDLSEQQAVRRLKAEVRAGFARKEDGALDFALLSLCLELALAVKLGPPAPQLRQILKRVRAHHKSQGGAFSPRMDRVAGEVSPCFPGVVGRPLSSTAEPPTIHLGSTGPAPDGRGGAQRPLNESSSSGDDSFRRQQLCLECRACCTSLAIPVHSGALDRAGREFFAARDCRIVDVADGAFVVVEQPCPHLQADGCDIYAERPELCRLYDGSTCPVMGPVCLWNKS